MDPQLPLNIIIAAMESKTNHLLACYVCTRTFVKCKNQNSNLRRHIKVVHGMSPSMHPPKCRWDSLPMGRVKDDVDRKERTRKSQRNWARKFRQRRKIEEAAMILCMLKNDGGRGETKN